MSDPRFPAPADGVLVIVLARGGSKGIPRKNLEVVGGHSLVARAVMSGRDAGLPVLLTSDDPDIRREGEAAGAMAPFERPPHLATDESASIEVLRHAAQWFESESGTKLVTLVILQPTSPLRRSDDVRGALAAFKSRPKVSRSLISLSATGHLNPGILYRSSGEGTAVPISDPSRASRHDTPPIMIRNGAVYIAERDLVVEDGLVMCPTPAFYLMPRWRGVNVDDAFELYLARLLEAHPPEGEAAER